MIVVYVIAAIAIGLLLTELLLPTGGALAAIGALGLIASGVVALNSNSSVADAVGAALITGGVLAAVSFIFIARKVAQTHRDEPVHTGRESLIGTEAEVRVPLDPVGQVYSDGSLWKARVAGDARVDVGNRVRIESLDGLTLVVAPLAPSKTSTEEEN